MASLLLKKIISFIGKAGFIRVRSVKSVQICSAGDTYDNFIGAVHSNLLFHALCNYSTSNALGK